MSTRDDPVATMMATIGEFRNQLATIGAGHGLGFIILVRQVASLRAVGILKRLACLPGEVVEIIVIWIVVR